MISKLLRSLRPLDGLIVIVGVVSVALTIAQWGRIFAGNGHIIPIVAASFLAAIGSLTAARMGARSALSLVAAIVTLGLFLAVWHAGAIGDLPRNLIKSWKALASTGLLIPASKSLVIVPVIVSFFATWVAVDIAARRRIGSAVVLPLSAAHGTALAYTISQGPSPWWYALAVGASVLALMVLSTIGSTLASQETSSLQDGADPTNAPVRWRQGAVALPIVISLAGAGFVVNRALVERDAEAFDLRERLVRPLDVFEATTPLARVKGGLVEPSPTQVFGIAVDGLTPDAAISLLPVAALDRYDGAVWTSTARFEIAGASLPLPSQAGARFADSTTVAIELTQDYPFRFLPRIGVVTDSVNGELGWDPRSGSIARTDGPRQDFRFVTRQALNDRNLDERVSFEGVPDAVRYAASPPPLSDDQLPIFSQFLSESTTGATTELERLDLIEETLLSADFGYNTEAPAGHSLASLASYLSPTGQDGEAVNRVGFAEQSAAVFAVLARQLGLPSRVMVGYQLPEPLTSENNQVVVTEDMIHAWPEVWIGGLGWTAFEPTDPGNETAEQTARTPAVSSDGTQAQVADLPELQEPILIPKPEAGQGRIGRFGSLVALVLVPLLYLLVVVGGKRLRRSRRRRSGDAAERTIGAWSETRDRLGSLGLPSAKSSTVMDIAEELDLRELGTVADPVSTLSPLVDDALFSPATPPAASVDAAWKAADEAMAAARKSQSRRTRIKASIKPGSLLGR